MKSSTSSAVPPTSSIPPTRARMPPGISGHQWTRSVKTAERRVMRPHPRAKERKKTPPIATSSRPGIAPSMRNTPRPSPLRIPPGISSPTLRAMLPQMRKTRPSIGRNRRPSHSAWTNWAARMNRPMTIRPTPAIHPLRSTRVFIALPSILFLASCLLPLASCFLLLASLYSNRNRHTPTPKNRAAKANRTPALGHTSASP